MITESNKNIENKRFLGIDPGSAKVGLAIADDEIRMAFAYATLKNNKDFWENFSKIIEKEGISVVIIGIPSYLNKKEIVYPGEKMGQEIGKRFPDLEVFYQNEMFSTKMAQERLCQAQVRRVSAQDDQEAARIILESWLENKKENIN